MYRRRRCERAVVDGAVSPSRRRAVKRYAGCLDVRVAGSWLTGEITIIENHASVSARRVFAASLALVVLAAACGGGGSGTSTPARARKTPSGPCQIARADVDGDGAVSIFDLTRVSSHFGESVPPAAPELDQDGDNAITILDISLVQGVFIRRVDDCP